MPYDAFTIDTNKAIKNGLNLEGGLLGELTQFKDAQIDFVLSEIVVREIHKHLLDLTKKANDSLTSAAAKVRSAQLVEGASADQFKALIEAMPEPKRVAGDRLSRFIEATGAEPIPAKLAAMDALVGLYFSSSPPFEATGPKKTEFPDAIALLSLETWAKMKGKKLLAVSDDKGWLAFAEKSDYLDVEADFAKALETVQDHAGAAEAAVGQWLAAIEGGNLADEAKELENGLTAALAAWQFHAEGHSALDLELDSVELVLRSFEFDKPDDSYDITVVRMGSSEVVARIGMQFNVTARADFSLSVYDSIDKDYVGMGSQSAEREVEFEGAILLTLTGDFSEQITGLEIYEIEIVDAIGSVNFGEIELDYDEDEEDYRAWFSEHEGESDEVELEGQASMSAPPF